MTRRETIIRLLEELLVELKADAPVKHKARRVERMNVTPTAEDFARVARRLAQGVRKRKP